MKPAEIVPPRQYTAARAIMCCLLREDDQHRRPGLPIEHSLLPAGAAVRNVMWSNKSRLDGGTWLKSASALLDRRTCLF
jgi:hypothetical protein